MYGFLIAYWAIAFVSISMTGCKHGQFLEGNHNIGNTFFNLSLNTAILFGAGFWTQPILWPKIVIAILYVLSFFVAVAKHGKPKSGRHNFWGALIVITVTVAIITYPLAILYNWI